MGQEVAMVSIAKKRQAHEVIAEIEKKWRQRYGVMMWSWSLEHVTFLILRWEWKAPDGHDRRMFFIDLLDEALARRRETGLPTTWLYMHKSHMRELMQGAALNTSLPVRESRVTNFSVIELPQRALSKETIA
jgi:hypothetical protein